MNQRNKQKIVEAIRPRNSKTNKFGKEQILDEFITSTGNHRKASNWVLRNAHKTKRIMKKPDRRKVYQDEVVNVLERIWKIYGRICSKRLHIFLAEGVKELERSDELRLSPVIKELLLGMSRAIIDL